MSLLGESEIYLRFLLSLGTVLGLIIVCAWALKAFRDRSWGWPRGTASKRLEIVETLVLDPKRRLMVVRKDREEYFLLLGANGETQLDNSKRSLKSITGSQPQRRDLQ